MVNMIDTGDEARSMENPNIPLGSPEVWNEVFGSDLADTGEAVNSKKALSLAPVWQAVSLISGDVAKLPINVYRRRPDLGERGREVDRGHVAQNLIRWKSNPHMSAFKFWRRLMTHALLYGNAYALIDRDPNGKALGLYPLLPDRTQPQIRDDGSMFYVSEIGGELVTFFGSQVMHLEHISIRGDADCELVSVARNSLALGLAQNKFASRFFQHGARIGGILEVPPGMTKVAADNLEQGFRKTYEAVDNAFKTVILREGSKFHAGQFNAQEAQMVAARSEQVKDIARWYNLPPHKLGDDSRTSYSSLEQENRSYLDSCLSPWLHTIQAECWMKLLTTPEQDAGSHFVEHNIDALIQADTLTKYQVGRMGIEMGVLSPDEFRAMQNMNPRPDGRGGVYLRPLNMTVAGDDEAQGDDSASRDATRYVMLDAIDDAVGGLLGVVTRAVKRKTASRFCSWVDGSLDSDTMETVQCDLYTAVMAYCAVRRTDVLETTSRIMEALYSRLHRQLDKLLESTGQDDIKATVVDNAASLRVDLPELILKDVEKDDDQ
jgi:HK97 family phage portal protein